MKKKILIWTLTAALTALAIVHNGIVQYVEFALTALTWYFIGAGLIRFLFWFRAYRALKKLEKSGLLYLALVREAFSK